MPTPLPTFDEWFEAKYGQTFEERHQHYGAWHDDVIRALSRETRDYISEMAALAAEPKPPINMPAHREAFRLYCWRRLAIRWTDTEPMPSVVLADWSAWQAAVEYVHGVKAR